MTVMDVKKPQSTASEVTRTAGKSKTKQLREFVGDLKSEIEKVNWTSKEELLTYTKIIIGATFTFGLGIYFADLFIQTVLQGLANFVRWIT